MEVIEVAGLQVFLGTVDAKKGDNWVSQTAPGLWLGATVSGSVKTRQSGQGTRNWSDNSLTHFYTEQIVETEHKVLQTGSISGAFVRIAPEALETILDDEDLTSRLQTNKNLDAHLCPMHIKSLAWQMLSCPHQGTARRLYIASRAMGYICHSVLNNAPSCQINQSSDACRSYSAADIENFYEARSILLSDLRDPPSVPELAKRVGLNSRKLEQGFAQFFGTTVYAYLKTQRFDQARLLLESGTISSVSESAYRFGYSPAHFSSEFRRQFGISPSTYLKSNGRS